MDASPGLTGLVSLYTKHLSQVLTFVTATRFSVPNDACNYPSLPGVDLPDGYQTPFSSAGMEGSYSFFGDEPALTYDHFTQQVVPFVITIPKPSDSEVKFVCVTPNNTQAGSQELGEKPWESAAPGGQVVSRVALVATGIVVLVLTL